MIKSIKNSNKERKIIGLNTNKIAPNNSHFVPLTHIVKTRVTNDVYRQLKDKCLMQWNDCTSISICNKVLDINQRGFDGKEITDEDQNFVMSNLENSSVKNLNDCFMKNYSSIEASTVNTTTSTPIPVNTSPVDTSTIQNYQPIVLLPLFKNIDELNSFNTTFKYKIIKFIGVDDITTFYRELNKGLVSLKILDNNFNTNTKIIIEGGENDGKIFYNRKTEIPLYTSLNDMESPSYLYHKLNKHEIIGTGKYLSIQDLYDSGMNSFGNNNSTSFTTDTNFLISGGEYNGRLFKNKIDEIIENGVLCNLFYKMPFIGNTLCGYNDYSLFFLAFIIILICIIIFIAIFLSKSSKKKIVIKSNKISSKKQTTTQK